MQPKKYKTCAAILFGLHSPLFQRMLLSYEEGYAAQEVLQRMFLSYSQIIKEY